MTPPPSGPEAEARIEIDAALETAGWVVQNREEMNLSVAQGVAVREFKLKHGHGYADYLLFMGGKAVGVLEAKAPGHTLIGVEPQSTKYANGLPDGLNPPITPLPFLYLSTGGVTKFTNLLDPAPRSRFVFHLHRPETVAEWLSAPTLDTWVKDNGAYTAADDTKPSSLRARLRAMPELEPGGLYPNQIQAIVNLEASMRQDKPRALLQMATGSGKTLTSVAEIYRLIKFGGARRVLFLVDRSNLGEQAEKEFQNFETPDDHRKFTELYNVQRLTSNTIDAASRVVITTIQRLFSMLKGDEAFEEPEGDEAQLDAPDSLTKEPIPVAFNPTIPPEYFDIIFIDECHRSIYSLWRQVLEYFDAFLIGLTATPAKHTFGFFNKNLIMDYGHEQAVVDGVNVDFEIYKIRTKITEGGSTIDAEDGTMIGLRVLTNPPFGKKSSVTVVNEEGDTDREALVYNRPDFWVTTSNKQLNFVQHVKSLLKVHGRAGVVLPDNVLFEGGAGETVRGKLLHECDLHTILRLPTGIFYAQGVKANVLFFDRKPGSDKPWTKKVWVYDHRTNCHYTLKTKTMTRANLDEFVACYRPGDIHNRKQTWSEKKHPEGRWRSFTFDEIAARDKCSLDLFWLRDESLEDSASLPDPHILAQEIADDLRSALGQIEDILGDLETRAARA